MYLNIIKKLIKRHMGLIGPIRGRGVSPHGPWRQEKGAHPPRLRQNPPLGISPTPEVEGGGTPPWPI